MLGRGFKIGRSVGVSDVDPFPHQEVRILILHAYVKHP